MEADNQYRFDQNLVSGGYQLQKFQRSEKENLQIEDGGKIGFGELKDHVVVKQKQNFFARLVAKAFPALGRVFEDYNRIVISQRTEGIEFTNGKAVRDQIKGYTNHLKEVNHQIKEAKKEIKKQDQLIRAALTFDTDSDKNNITNLVLKRNELIGQLVGFRQEWVNVKKQLGEIRQGAEGTFLQGASVMVQLGRTEKKLDQTFQYFQAGLVRTESSFRFQALKENIDGYVASMTTSRTLHDLSLGAYAANDLSRQHILSVKAEVDKMVALKEQALTTNDTNTVIQIDTYLASLPPECTEHIRETGNSLPSSMQEEDRKTEGQPVASKATEHNSEKPRAGWERLAGESIAEHGKLGRKEAEEKLKGMQPGSFLIRKSNVPMPRSIYVSWKDNAGIIHHERVKKETVADLKNGSTFPGLKLDANLASRKQALLDSVKAGTDNSGNPIAVVDFHKDGPTQIFGNFAPCQVSIGGKTFQCSEAAFHYLKYSNYSGSGKKASEKELEKFTTMTGREALAYARKLRDQGCNIQSNWGRDQATGGGRDYVMYQVLQAKFQQNPDFKELLDATQGMRLIEHPHGKVVDTYWGDHGDGTGVNRLGLMLEAIRDGKPYVDFLISNPDISVPELTYAARFGTTALTVKPEVRAAMTAKVAEMVQQRVRAVEEGLAETVAQIDAFLMGLPSEYTRHLRETGNALPSRMLEFDKPGTEMTEETRKAIGSQGLTTNYDGTVAISHESYGTAQDKEEKQGRNCDRAFGEKTPQGNFRFGVFDGSGEEAKSLKTASACMSYSHGALTEGALSQAKSKEDCTEVGKRIFSESVNSKSNPLITKAPAQADPRSAAEGIMERSYGETTALILETEQIRGKVVVKGAALGDCSAFALTRNGCSALYKEPSLRQEGVGKNVGDTPGQLRSVSTDHQNRVIEGAATARKDGKTVDSLDAVEGIYDEVDRGSILIAASDALTDNLNHEQLEEIVQFIAHSSAFDSVPEEPPANIRYQPPPAMSDLKETNMTAEERAEFESKLSSQLRKPTLQDLTDMFGSSQTEEMPTSSKAAERLNNYIEWIAREQTKNMEEYFEATGGGRPPRGSLLENLKVVFGKGQTGKLDDATVVAVQV